MTAHARPAPPRARSAPWTTKKKAACRALAVVAEVQFEAPARHALAEAAEDAIVGFGRWLLEHVFADAAAALDDDKRRAAVPELQRL